MGTNIPKENTRYGKNMMEISNYFIQGMKSSLRCTKGKQKKRVKKKNEKKTKLKSKFEKCSPGPIGSAH